MFIVVQVVKVTIIIALCSYFHILFNFNTHNRYILTTLNVLEIKGVMKWHLQHMLYNYYYFLYLEN